MRRIRWGDVLLSSVAAVGWSLIVMASVAGLGLHLLGADAAGTGAAEGSLGAMTAAAVVLAIGGTVTPSGDVSVLGVIGTGAETSLDVMPLGVSLAGALVLAPLFLRSLRAGAGHGETAARVVVLAALFVATAAGLAWVGHDVVTLDGTPPLPRTPAKVEIPGIGDIGGLLPDRVGDLIGARTRVGFSVELGPTLLGAGLWVLAVLALALLVSRRGRPRRPGCVRWSRRWWRRGWSRWRRAGQRRCGRPRPTTIPVGCWAGRCWGRRTGAGWGCCWARACRYAAGSRGLRPGCCPIRWTI